MLDGSRLSKTFHGKGDRSESFSVTDAAGDNAIVGCRVKNSSSYSGKYTLSPNYLDYARADMRLEVSYADAIEAFALAKSRDTLTDSNTDAGSSTLIAEGSLNGYKNSAYSTKGLAKTSQSCDFASGNSVGFYGGTWNEEGQSLQFQTLVSGAVTNYSNSAKATPITGIGMQRFDNASGEWYIQECALDYTGPEAGNSAGSFWWGDGTVQNYRGNTKAALTQKIASAEADQVAGNAVFGTNAYMNFNQPGTQDALISLKIENGYLESCHNEAKIKLKGQQQFAQSSQQFYSLNKLDESEASIRLEALAINQKIDTINVFTFDDARVDQISEIRVTARSIFDNVSIEYQLPSNESDEEKDLVMINN